MGCLACDSRVLRGFENEILGWPKAVVPVVIFRFKERLKA
jgi:hypothetical protein